MKYLLLPVTMWLFSFSLSAQCCPYMGGIETLPANPQAGDNVSIITQVATPNFGHLITRSHAIINDTIWIDACYYSGMITVVAQISDTFAIGSLSAGTYGVVFRAMMSNDPDNCFPSDQNQLDTNLVIGVAGIGAVVSDYPIIYPNPVTDQLFVRSEVVAASVYSSVGQLVDLTFHQTPQGLVADVRQLPSGVYFLTATLKNNEEVMVYPFVK